MQIDRASQKSFIPGLSSPLEIFQILLIQFPCYFQIRLEDYTVTGPYSHRGFLRDKGAGLGNQRQDIFLDDQDRTEYLKRLARYKRERGFLLYAYVLMTNHYHLLVETLNTPISKIMQLINFTYTQYFNKKYGKVGHLFQGRYKSILCDRDQYLLSLVRYIHLNPVRAKLVNDPGEYRWSGHRDYLGDTKGLVDTERVLGIFSEGLSQGRRRYRDFVNDGIKEGRNEDFYRVISSQVLGDDRFLDQVETKMKRAEGSVRKRSLQAVLKAVKEVTGVREEDLLSRGRGKEALFARGVMVGVWRQMGCKLVDLRPSLRRDLSVLSRISKIAESREGQRAMDQVFELLNARMQA